MTPWLLRLILADDDRPAPWAIWAFARDNIRFHAEHPQVVATVRRLLDAPVGDCNDLTVLVTSLAHAARLPTRWALGFDQFGEPIHIWAQVYHGGQWLDVDPSPYAGEPGVASVVDVPGSLVVGFDIVAGHYM